MKMAASTEQILIEDDYRCGYCCQQKNDMDDPRILPCKHVFCLSCISSDYRHGSSLECPVCRVKHEDIIVRDLPRYISKKGIPCSVCGLIAEMWCNQCNIYMCTQHALQHDEGFASLTAFVKHEKAVGLNARQNVMQKKEMEFCTKHTNEKIIRACSVCYEALCVECTLSDKCSQDERHFVEKMENLGEKLKKELIDIMSELYVKSTVLSDVEKEANVILANEEKKYVEMKALVDTVTEEQVTEIKEKANKIKSEIDETFKANTEAVKKYCAELLTDKNASDGLRRDIHSLINFASDLEVIKEYNNILKTSAELCKNMPLELSLPSIEIRQLAKQREAEIEVSPTCHKIVIPSKQTFLSAKEDKEPKGLIHISSAAGSFLSAYWLHDKSLVCGTLSKVEIRDRTLTIIKSHQTYQNMWTVCQYGSGYFVLLYDNGSKVDLYSCDFTYEKTLIRASLLTGCGRMTVNYGKILLIDHLSQFAKLYTTDGAHLRDIDLQTHITSVCGIQFLDKNSFIVSDIKGGKVSKCKLETKCGPVWVCTNLEQPMNISIDTSGFIYVASQTKAIYVLTQSGLLLNKFTPPDLYAMPKGLSITEDILAVLSDGGVQLFKILF